MRKREAIAEATGLTMNTVCRTLQQLRREGRVVLSARYRGEWRLPDA
jgi:hypothetical protein